MTSALKGNWTINQSLKEEIKSFQITVHWMDYQKLRSAQNIQLATFILVFNIKLLNPPLFLCFLTRRKVSHFLPLCLSQSFLKHLQPLSTSTEICLSTQTHTPDWWRYTFKFSNLRHFSILVQQSPYMLLIKSLSNP